AVLLPHVGLTYASTLVVPAYYSWGQMISISNRSEDLLPIPVDHCNQPGKPFKLHQEDPLPGHTHAGLCICSQHFRAAEHRAVVSISGKDSLGLSVMDECPSRD